MVNAFNGSFFQNAKNSSHTFIVDFYSLPRSQFSLINVLPLTIISQYTVNVVHYAATNSFFLLIICTVSDQRLVNPNTSLYKYQVVKFIIIHISSLLPIV